MEEQEEDSRIAWPQKSGEPAPFAQKAPIGPPEIAVIKIAAKGVDPSRKRGIIVKNTDL